MKSNLIVALTVLLGNSLAFSQDSLDTGSSEIKNESSIREAQAADLLAELAVKNLKREARVKNYLNSDSKKPIPSKQDQNDGTVLELYDVQDGVPVYRATYNQNSAETMGTDLVRSGGGLGFDLDGTNAPTIGIWDGGAVRTSHVELSGRVTQKDNARSNSNHATHVAGTMVASGFDQPSMGMAPNGTVDAYDWYSDETEMLNANVMLSNHSYGYIRGWYWGGWRGDASVSQVEDYQFGRYNEYSRSWDQIANVNYRHLIVKAAGNDRSDKGPSNSIHQPDGDWDCIADQGMSKNILTVGAVHDIVGGYKGPSSVSSAWFSSWGPADDGRVKPDIVANGVTLKSSTASSDNSYGSYSGTSMAAPSVTGSLALLHELESEMPANIDSWSSTYKGLIIHSADEAGNFDGPDYSFGWGLMNTARAAEIIRFNYSGCQYSAPMSTELGLLKNIYELSINRGQVKEFEVYKVDGEPLKVTVSWNDPAGDVGPRALDDPTPALINDIDLRVISADGQIFFPWKLNPNNPSSAATTGDNNVDNTEQVVVNNLAEGRYTVKLNMESTSRSSKQNISLIITGNDRLIQDLTLSPQSATSLDRNIANGESEYLKIRNKLVIDDQYTVQDGGEATFRASEIVLKPGFHAKPGSSSLLSLEMTCEGRPALNRKKSSNSDDFRPETEDVVEENEIASVEDELINQLNVHPNPVADLLNIEFGTYQVSSIETISISSIQGQILMEKTQEIGQIETIDFSTYNKGIYLVNVLLKDGNSISKKIVKK